MPSTRTPPRRAAAAAAAPPGLGPVLRFRGSDEASLRLSVTSVGGLPGSTVIGRLGGAEIRAVDLTLPRPPDGGPVPLPLGLRDAAPGLPPSIAASDPSSPLRIAFATCNGAEDEEALAQVPGGRNAMWAGLLARDAAAPFHLLVMGGDQIYADALWDLPLIRAWRRTPRGPRLRAPFTDAMRAELEAHYLATYIRAFGSPEVAAALARIPSVMMWDDHDIVDGWGSRDAAWQAAPVAQGVFAVARRAFALVQLGIDPDRPPPARHGFAAADGAGFGWAGDYGPARLVVPDLRSGRSRRRVMEEAAHRHLGAAVADHERPHAIVVSTVPLVNADLSVVERVVAPLMRVADLYQDDLRDQWMSHAHRREWRAVMGRLLDAAAARRVSVLSGEIHLGARGVARSGGGIVEQFIASGIAHPPPPPALARLVERLAPRTRRRAGIEIDMRPVAHDGRRYVAERNWLEVAAHPDGGLDAVLHAERSGALVLASAAPETVPAARETPVQR